TQVTFVSNPVIRSAHGGHLPVGGNAAVRVAYQAQICAPLGQNIICRVVVNRAAIARVFGLHHVLATVTGVADHQMGVVHRAKVGVVYLQTRQPKAAGTGSLLRVGGYAYADVARNYLKRKADPNAIKPPLGVLEKKAGVAVAGNGCTVAATCLGDFYAGGRLGNGSYACGVRGIKHPEAGEAGARGRKVGRETLR